MCTVVFEISPVDILMCWVLSSMDDRVSSVESKCIINEPTEDVSRRVACIILQTVVGTRYGTRVAILFFRVTH